MEQNITSFEIGKEFLKKMTTSVNQIHEDLQNFELENISLQNLHTLQLDLFEFLQEYKTDFDSLYQIFSEDYNNTLKSQISTTINPDLIKRIGTVLLFNKLINKPGVSPQFIYEISKEYWEDVHNTLWKSPEFNPILIKIKKHYLNTLETKIQQEIEKIGFEIAPEIKENYRIAYLKEPLTFQTFIENYQQKPIKNQESSIKETPSTHLRDQFEKEIERKKIEDLKIKQSESFDNYNEYFNMDERELARLKRNPNEKRSISKISRRDKYSKSGGK